MMTSQVRENPEEGRGSMQWKCLKWPLTVKSRLRDQSHSGWNSSKKSYFISIMSETSEMSNPDTVAIQIVRKIKNPLDGV